MTFDSSLTALMEDTVTIEPYSSMTSEQVYSYGTAVTYAALVQRGVRRLRDATGREADSNVQVIIPDRVAVDVRSRITLPSGFSPQTPPIIAVEPLKGLGLDHTVVYC